MAFEVPFPKVPGCKADPCDLLGRDDWLRRQGMVGKVTLDAGLKPL